LSLESDALMVEAVPELGALRRKVALVLRVGLDLDRHLLDDRQAEALHARGLARVVGEDADRAEAEVGEDLVADAPLPRVGRKAELEVRLDRVEALLLQLVRLQLVEEPDPATLLRHVEEHPAIFGGDAPEGEVELLAAVAAQRVEDVAGDALRVDA